MKNLSPAEMEKINVSIPSSEAKKAAVLNEEPKNIPVEEKTNNQPEEETTAKTTPPEVVIVPGGSFTESKHTCSRMLAGGLLVKVEPRNPQEGQTATVEVHSLAAFLRDTIESQEMEMYPGALKNDVIKFCAMKMAACRCKRGMADKESYILLWDMLVLLLRQNG